MWAQVFIACTRRVASLWIGTEEGLKLLDGGEVNMIEALGRQPVHAVTSDSGTVWVGAQDGLWAGREDVWTQIDAGDPLLAGGIYALLLVEPDGILLAGTPFGVAYRDQETKTWQVAETPDELGEPALVQAIAGHARKLWTGSDGAGAFSFDLEAGTVVNAGFTGDSNLTTRFVRDVAIDGDGSVWLATPAGVFRYQQGMWFTDVQGGSIDDPRNYINDLLVARDGQLWIATGGGGVRHKGGVSSEESVYDERHGLPRITLVLAQDASDAIWVGTFEGLFRFQEGEWDTPIAASQLPDTVISALFAEGEILWIGTEAGLATYQIESGEVNAEPALTGQTIEAIAADSSGQLWVGTNGDGIWTRLADGSWLQHRHVPGDPESLPGNYIIGSGLAPDPHVDGAMWAIVFQEGLVQWDGAKWSEPAANDELPSNLLWTLEEDVYGGSLWVGTEAGVSRNDGETWGTLTIEDGLRSAIIYAVAPEPGGGYWLGGRTGLSHFLPDSTAPWLEIGSLSGERSQGEDGELTLTVGDQLVVNFDAGDLQTPHERLRILYREVAPNEEGAWRDVPPGSVAVQYDTPGLYTLQFRVRDLSFNYAETTDLVINAISPPPMVSVPLLGPVETNVFRALAILGSIAMLGASYVTLEILQNRRKSIDAVNRGFNPYISGEPVRRDDMFFGRRDLVRRIVDTLHNNSIMIHGERRIGKTTLLYQLAAVLRDVDDADYWFVPVYVDLEGTPQEEFFHYLMEEIVDGVRRLPDAQTILATHLLNLRYEVLASERYDDRDFNRDMRRVTVGLQQYSAEHEPGLRPRLILLMDEMDVMSQYDHLVQQQLRRIFMRDFAATLGAVVAGIQISKDWDRVESPWYNLFNEIALEPFTREQGLELLIEPVRGYYVYESSALEFILEHSAGRPYRIQQYGLEAVNSMLERGRRRITLGDVEVAHRRIQAMINGVDATYAGGDQEPPAPAWLRKKLARERRTQSAKSGGDNGIKTDPAV